MKLCFSGLELVRLVAGLCFKQDLKETERKIMSAIQEFAAKQAEFQARITTAVDGLSNDVKSLKDKIDQLQSNPGPISAEDQALLDQITSETDAIVQKLEALDGLTPAPEPTPEA